MSYYSVNLPSYTIGEGCYKEIPHTTRFYGKTAVVIGGKIAMSKAKDKILEGILTNGQTMTIGKKDKKLTFSVKEN